MRITSRCVIRKHLAREDVFALAVGTVSIKRGRPRTSKLLGLCSPFIPGPRDVYLPSEIWKAYSWEATT